MAAARSGDRGAFEQLVVLTTPEVFALARRLLGNDHDASDVVQETYLRAFRAIGRFRGEAAISTWLFRITANCCATHLARRRRARHVVLDDAALGLADPRAEAALVDAGDSIGERARLRLALDSLPAPLRLVVVLFDIYDLSHDEIARELGISRTAAKVRLHRGRRRLRELLVEPSAPHSRDRDATSDVRPATRRSARAAAV